MQDDGHTQRVKANLMGSGLFAFVLGACWGIAFFIADRPLVAAIVTCMALFGLGVFWLAREGRVTMSALLIGHFLPVFVGLLCLFDRAPEGLHRASPLHFLAFALAGYFIFRGEGIYLRYVLPAICLAAYVVLSATSIGFHDPELILPEGMALASVWINTATATISLIFIVIVMNMDLTVRRALEIDMRKAIQNGDFQLHYQPQIAEQGQIVGAEALIRWRHPRMGNIPPADFIPLAEETGLIVPIGNWVLRAACAQLALWEAQPETQHLTISVNVSASQFRQPDFVQSVTEIVRLSGITPAKLKLELTESMFVENVDATTAKMNALKAIGIVWSLDDFGTGYSSLSVLHRFPLGQIKIDKAFVRDMLTNKSNMVVTEAIIALAAKLNLQVIAEGVETVAQLNRLREAGCHAYQGYLFSPPVDIEAFAKLLVPEAAPTGWTTRPRPSTPIGLDRVAMSLPARS